MFRIIHTVNSDYFLKQHNWSVFIMETQLLLCEVQTEFWYVIQIKFMLQNSTWYLIYKQNRAYTLQSLILWELQRVCIITWQTCYLTVYIIVDFLFVILTCSRLVADWDILVVYCYYIRVHNGINHAKVASKLQSPTSKTTSLPRSNQSVIQFTTKFRGTVLCNLKSLKTEHWTP